MATTLAAALPIIPTPHQQSSGASHRMGGRVGWERREKIGEGRDPAEVARRMPWSDVVVETSRPVLWGRRWSAREVTEAALVVVVHGLCLMSPFYFTWGAAGVAAVLYFLTGLLGVTLSFHRNLSHRSFLLPKWLEYAFAYFGSLALQGNPMSWVSIHRYHHKYCDTPKDPHSPTQGFLFSHIGWIFDHATLHEKIGEGYNNVRDMSRQPFYRFMKDTYVLHPIALAVLLYAVGGLPWLVWGTGVRTVVVHHGIWLINSVGHIWGQRRWNTTDNSKNNWFVALVSFGEGWHNNHHAFEQSARHGLEWWQLDLTWYIVKLLEAVGLATDVRLPTKKQMEKMSIIVT